MRSTSAPSLLLSGSPRRETLPVNLQSTSGLLGVKQSSAQITRRYNLAQLVGRQVLAVTNFPPKRIAGFKSEVLVLGAVPEEGDVVLINVDEDVPNGVKVG